MENDNKKSENNLPYEKDDQPSMEKSLDNSMIAWTPGNEQTITGKVFQQGGITKTKSKQESPIIDKGYVGG